MADGYRIPAEIKEYVDSTVTGMLFGTDRLDIAKELLMLRRMIIDQRYTAVYLRCFQAAQEFVDLHREVPDMGDVRVTCTEIFTRSNSVFYSEIWKSDSPAQLFNDAVKRLAADLATFRDKLIPTLQTSFPVTVYHSDFLPLPPDSSQSEDS